MTRGAALLIVLSLAGRPVRAAPLLKLPAVFSDGAVLQAGRPVPVWGWATPGARIGVAVAGQKKTAVAGRDGRWRVTLAALTPGPVGDLAVTSGGTTAVSHDLLAGEVWVCSGQSNMGFGLSGAVNGPGEVRAASSTCAASACTSRSTVTGPRCCFCTAGRATGCSSQSRSRRSRATTAW